MHPNGLSEDNALGGIRKTRALNGAFQAIPINPPRNTHFGSVPAALQEQRKFFLLPSTTPRTRNELILRRLGQGCCPGHQVAACFLITSRKIMLGGVGRGLSKNKGREREPHQPASRALHMFLGHRMPLRTIDEVGLKAFAHEEHVTESIRTTSSRRIFVGRAITVYANLRRM